MRHGPGGRSRALGTPWSELRFFGLEKYLLTVGKSFEGTPQDVEQSEGGERSFGSEVVVKDLGVEEKRRDLVTDSPSTLDWENPSQEKDPDSPKR